MSLRPACARWFELLTTRDEVATVLELLAGTGAVEPEIGAHRHRYISFRDIRGPVERFRSMERRYHAYWPPRDARAEPPPGGPDRVLQFALDRLQAWEKQAAPLIASLEALTAAQHDLNLFLDMLALSGSDGLDYALLAGTGRILLARVLVLPPHSQVEHSDAALLLRHYRGAKQDFVLAVGTPQQVELLVESLSGLKARVVPVPDFIEGDGAAAARQIAQRQIWLDAQLDNLRRQIAALGQRHRLPAALAALRRIDWFLEQVERLPVSPLFAWITGWTDDLEGSRIEAALASGGVRALVHYPPPPPGLRPPTVLRNRGWGRWFEPLVRLLGAPAASEADPSALLAVLVPLMFGYMFGDVGQGLVLVAAGLLLGRRRSLPRILIVNGCAATLFGFLFGSVFGREDIIAPLWLSPLEHPLTVLQVPLAGGALVLLLGLALKGLQYHWQGAARRWWRVEAPLLLLYVAILLTPFSRSAAVPAGLAGAWYLLGSVLERRDAPVRGLALALGELVEDLMQLLINTLSFVRVGAFALAHAGLALAFTTLAAMPDNRLVAFLVLLVGNLLVIVLEGLVVTIQTTRLVLFEFFTRFMRADGRAFRALAAPARSGSVGGGA
jgi:V/A-type H+-transporting ATPase subunit I